MDELDRAVAGMFCVGFDGLTPSPAVLKLLGRGVRSAIIFQRNIESPRQVWQLCCDLKAASTRPFLISVDQEGGRVQRLRQGFTSIVPMRTLGRTHDVELARQLGRAMARELRAVNIDLDFAPVMDVDTNPANPVIGDRSFSSEVRWVTQMGCALIDGLQSGGVAACAKHFPGHGDTATDSHLELPRLAHPLARLREVELPPFAAAARQQVASIMTAHVLFDALDAQVPATMSRPVLEGILRRELGFDGVIISDDLEMKAIADHFGLEEALVGGALAGVDMFLVCHSPDVKNRAIDLLTSAVRRGVVPEASIAAANQRIDALMRRFVRPAGGLGDAPGCAEHQRLIETILAAAP